MSAGTTWWVIAGVLLAAELLTGTFFLLMLAVGAVAAALAALAGWDATAQMAVAAAIGGGAALAWYARLRGRRTHGGKQPASLGTHADPDLALDLGQTVTVPQWAADGSAQVHYRGSLWTARLQSPAPPGDAPAPGNFRIVAMQGNVLLLDKV